MVAIFVAVLYIPRPPTTLADLHPPGCPLLKQLLLPQQQAADCAVVLGCLRLQFQRNNHILRLQDQVLRARHIGHHSRGRLVSGLGLVRVQYQGRNAGRRDVPRAQRVSDLEGLSFSPNGPYDTAFALNEDGSQVRLGLSVAYVEGECADETAGRRVLHLHSLAQWEHVGR